MQLSLGSANWRQEMWVEIYDRARKKGRIRQAELGKHRFEYALINPRDGYGRDRISTKGGRYEYTGSTVTFWIKDAEKEGRCGLNEGRFAFVLERSVPPEFHDYVGLHEHIEAMNGQDHGLACRIELDELEKDPALFGRFADWIVGFSLRSLHPCGKEVGGFFDRAIPSFLEVLREGRLSPVEMLREFKRQLDELF